MLRRNALVHSFGALLLCSFAVHAEGSTLVLDEVELKAELPRLDHTQFFRPQSLSSNVWSPRVLSGPDRSRLMTFREKSEQHILTCLAGYRCRTSQSDLSEARRWVDLLSTSDDVRARLHAGLLRGWWLVTTYADDLQRSGSQKPKLDVSDALQYLAAQFATTNDPFLRAGLIYAQAKVAVWANDLDSAIEALMFLERTEESTLTPDLFAWLGSLEEARGRLEAAGEYYKRVRHGEYLAPSMVGIARISRHLGLCQETLKVGARFQTRVASREERERYLPELLLEEAICEALVVGPELVDELDGVNAPAVHDLAKGLTRQRSRLSAKKVVSDDLVACFNIQFPDYYHGEPLALSLAGTAGDLEVSQSGDAGLYGSNVIGALEACMQRRLTSGFANWRVEGEVRIVPVR